MYSYICCSLSSLLSRDAVAVSEGWRGAGITSHVSRVTPCVSASSPHQYFISRPQSSVRLNFQKVGGCVPHSSMPAKQGALALTRAHYTSYYSYT